MSNFRVKDKIKISKANLRSPKAIKRLLTDGDKMQEDLDLTIRNFTFENMEEILVIPHTTSERRTQRVLEEEKIYRD